MKGSGSACPNCGKLGHASPQCTSANPTVHVCASLHWHRCHHCGQVVTCCKPECRSLLEGYCVGFCGGGPLLNMRSLGRSEHSALAGPA